MRQIHGAVCSGRRFPCEVSLLSPAVYTYVQSRFYRSPEVILGHPYNMAIDMWSLGCIMAELYTGYPLFPGENEVEQLACIMEVRGPGCLPANTLRAGNFCSQTPGGIWLAVEPWPAFVNRGGLDVLKLCTHLS